MKTKISSSYTFDPNHFRFPRQTGLTRSDFVEHTPTPWFLLVLLILLMVGGGVTWAWI